MTKTLAAALLIGSAIVSTGAIADEAAVEVIETEQVVEETNIAAPDAEEETSEVVVEEDVLEIDEPSEDQE